MSSDSKSPSAIAEIDRSTISRETLEFLIANPGKCAQEIFVRICRQALSALSQSEAINAADVQDVLDALEKAHADVGPLDAQEIRWRAADLIRKLARSTSERSVGPFKECDYIVGGERTAASSTQAKDADLIATIDKLVRIGGKHFPCFDEDEFMDEVRARFAASQSAPKKAMHDTMCEKCGARVQAIMGECRRTGCEYFAPSTSRPSWIEEELKDGDRICEAAGVQRTEGGRLPVQKIINALVAQSRAPGSNRGAEGSRSSECISSSTRRTETRIAEDAIDLFNEYRAREEYTDEQAKAAAINEFADAAHFTASATRPMNDTRDVTQIIDNAAVDDLGVDRIAAAMKAKLAKKRGEGRGGWNEPENCTTSFLRRLLNEHLAKGDMVDVANLAMMLWNREHPTGAATDNRGSNG